MSQGVMQLIAGTETLDLLRGENVRFVNEGWVQAVSALQEATLGPPGAHIDVDETYTFNLTGNGVVAALYAAQAKLARMLRTARAQGRSSTPPYGLVKIQLPDSPNAPWYATITDVKMDGGSLLKMPANYLGKIHTSQIDDVQVTLTRRGAYQGETPEVVTTATSAVFAPQVVTFGTTASEYATLQAEIKTTASSSGDIQGATILVGRTADDFHIASGATLAAGNNTYWKVVPGTSSSAGAVARCTFPAAGNGFNLFASSVVNTPKFADAKRVGFWIKLRLPGLNPCLISITTIDALGSVSTVPYLVERQDLSLGGAVQLNVFPAIHLSNGMVKYAVVVQGTKAGAGSIEIAHVVALRLDDAACRSFVVAPREPDTSGDIATVNNIGIFRTRNWMREPSGVDYLTGTTPTLQGPLPFDQRTDLVSIGQSAALLRIMIGFGDDGDPLWNGTAWQWTARRWPSALVPV